MSNISRRDFLKTAGVMTLAVAAAGVLAGCNTTSVPAPDAGQPEVTTNSVSYTGYFGDKLTIESVGRYNVYNNRDKKELKHSQTVLKVTYTKPDFSTARSIVGVAVVSENGKETPDTAYMVTKVMDKTAISSNDIVYNFDDVLNANGTKTEKYVVLNVKGIKTNNLQVGVYYLDEKGEEKFLAMPLTVAASNLF